MNHLPTYQNIRFWRGQFKWLTVVALVAQSLYPLLAQTSLSGEVKDQYNQPIAHANVLLLHQPDSTLAKGAVTDEAGRYGFENAAAGTYLITASMVGYETRRTTLFTVGKGASQPLPLVVLQEGKALNEVTITAAKLAYELKPDRMIMNVSALPSMSGNTGLELLQKVPGVIVDRQNNSIGMIAKGEVLVMVNNKIKRVPAEVLMAQLQGMRAENIEQIELIHQPPAKYDASGAAGIINIVMKENEQEGTNGSVAITGGYGQREKAGLSLHLNSNQGVMNWYGDYTYNHSRANKFEVNHFRAYEYQGDDYYYENFVTLRNYREGQHAANLGLDLDFEGNTVIGLLVGGALSEQVWGEDADSRSFGYVNDKLTEEGSYLFSSKTDMSSLTANANVFQKIGITSHLNFNADYAKIRYENAGDLLNNDDPEHAIAYDRSTPMEFWILSLDNVNQLGDHWTMEAGVKGTFNNTLSTTSVRSVNDEYWSESDLLASEVSIREQILAGYLSFHGKLSEKLDAELGVRYEDYTYQLESEEQEDFERTFRQPFPVFRFNYKADSTNTIQLGFNRSITRSSFYHLTSLFNLFDPSLIVYANPQLQPAFTNNLKLSWQRKSAIFSLAYLSRNNQIYFYNTVDKENHLQISNPKNLDKESIIEANLSFSISPARWWEMNWNLTGYYHRVMDKSSRPSVFEEAIFTYAVQFNSTFLFSKDWTVGIDGWYRSHYLKGDQRRFDRPTFNLGIRKKFLSGSSLSVSVQDITNQGGQNNWEYHQPELGVKTSGELDLVERQVRITFTHLFGNQKLSGKRQRKTGSDDVKNRM